MYNAQKEVTLLTTDSVTFSVHGTHERITLIDPIAIVAGYTGRDKAAVQEHIDELAAIGIAPPPSVPMFYPVDADAITTAATIEVSGDRTSGEIEPLYIRHKGRSFLGISSDHTDRAVEADDIGASKKACPKPAGDTVIEVTNFDELDLDTARAVSFVDGELYQDGRLDVLRTPAEVIRLFLAHSDIGDSDFVCLGGTVPVKGGNFVYGTRWSISLELPTGQKLEHTYSVQMKGQ